MSRLRTDGPAERKPLEWVGSSYRDYAEFPAAVQDDAGYALYVAQTGGTHWRAKPLSGFGGADVCEVVLADRAGSFRVVYTVRYRRAVYVLHAFQKKSKRGARTPSEEMDVVHRRLALAEAEYAANYSDAADAV